MIWKIVGIFGRIELGRGIGDGRRWRRGEIVVERGRFCLSGGVECGHGEKRRGEEEIESKENMNAFDDRERSCFGPPYPPLTIMSWPMMPK